MSPVKRSFRKSTAEARPMIWVTSHVDPKPPKEAQLTVYDLDALWRVLEQLDCSGLFIDSRFHFKGGDAWEAALQIRERYPVLPLVVMTPVLRNMRNQGKAMIYVKKPL